MDDFLTKLYEEEMDKTAGAGMEEFMRTLPREELEAYILKQAVDGSTEAPLPDAASSKEMDAKQQAARKQIDKEHNGNPAPVHAETRTTNQVTKEAMLIADRAGRVMAKAAGCKSKMSAGDDPEAAPIGEPKKNGKEEPGKLKQSEGEDEGMENTAMAKAAMIERSLRLIRGAPDHIKLAAAAMTGREMAKVAKNPLRRLHESEKAQGSIWGTAGAGGGGWLGGKLGRNLGKKGQLASAALGALAGGAGGYGAGRLAARGNKAIYGGIEKKLSKKDR